MTVQIMIVEDDLKLREQYRTLIQEALSQQMVDF